MTSFLPHSKRFKQFCVLPAFVGLVLFAANCSAESTATAEWNISADKITRFQDPESIIAEGNIVLEKREKLPPPTPVQDTTVSDWAELLEEEVPPVEITPDDLPEDMEPRYVTTAVIKADWIAYDLEKETIRARGNVSIESGDDKLVAEEAEVKLATETGFFEEAVITRKDHDLHLEGKKIEKTGLKTYRIEDGWVITCKIEEGQVPPWSFSSSEATLEEGGYAVLKNAKFNIQNVPVFYLPYLVVPVKSTRQTGVLFPEISNSSRDGFGFNVPFFWNISDSTDMTFFGEYYSDRGVMPGVEFRYLVSEVNKGQLSASFLDDDLSDPDNVEYFAETGFTHTNTSRYWLRGKADHDFGNNWISRLDLDVVSDRDYLTEFTSGMTGFNDTQKSYLRTFGRGFENQDDDLRQNSFKVLKSWEGSSLGIDFLAIDDVRVVESSPTPLWTLPSVEYTGVLPINDSSFTFEWDADYVNYWRDDGIGGQRVDLFPRVSTPVPLGPYLESRAELGGRGTLYSLEEYGDAELTGDDTPSRFLVTFQTELATTLVRDYVYNSATSAYMTHSIRPFIEYIFVSDDDSDDLPNFDSVDTLEEINGFVYGVDSFLNLYDEDNNYTRQYAYFRLEQAYDLRSDAEEEFGPATLKLGWIPLPKLWFTYKAEIPAEDAQNTTHGFAGYFANSRGDIFSAEYRYNEDENVEQINAYMTARILPQIQAEFQIEHSISESETNEGIIALTYLQQCWSMQLRGKYTPTDERIMLVFNLANIGAPFSISY